MKTANSDRALVEDIFVGPERPYRSANLVEDSGDVGVFSRYFPTAKSVALMGTFLESLEEGRQDRATSVIAPYGSGKSSFMVVWGALLGNRGPQWDKAFETFFGRVKAIAPDVENSLRKLVSKKRYLVVRISGNPGRLKPAYEGSVREAFELYGVDENLVMKKAQSRSKEWLVRAIDGISRLGWSGIYFLHDEFGKVLESREMSASENLFYTQNLAEIAQRDGGSRLHLLISLHQGFSQYAHGLPPVERSEWAKVEGRFRPASFVEDSSQVLELIAQTIFETRGPRFKEATSGLFRWAEAAVAAPAVSTLFGQIPPSKLIQIAEKAYPLEPAALFFLPRLSARLSQNERTSFHFLLGFDEECLLPRFRERANAGGALPTVGVDVLYDYFAGVMRQDTGTGGTYKRWAEIETALQRVEEYGDVPSRIIKAIGLLSVVSQHSKVRLTSELISFAAGSDLSISVVSGWLKKLVARKVLFFRKHAGEYRIWEGSDIDLMGVVRQRVADLRGGLELTASFRKLFRPPSGLARGYNDEAWLVRYFRGEFITPDGLRNVVKDALKVPAGEDGLIYYVLADSEEGIRMANRAAAKVSEARVLIAVPAKPLRLREGIAEYSVLGQLLKDRDFLGQDPVLRREVMQLADDSLSNLRRSLAILTEPRRRGCLWWNAGKKCNVTDEASLSWKISEICRDNFKKTPEVRNEVINRKNPTRIMTNARRKMVRALLEKRGTRDLGLEGHGPDMTMFRTLLLKSAVYREGGSKENWRLAVPDEVEDRNVRAVLKKIESFIDNSAKEKTDFRPLIEELLSPPFGIRRGVIPVYVCAVILTYSKGLTLLHDGIYVKDFWAELFDEIADSPERVQVQSQDFPAHINKYLSDIAGVFSRALGENTPDVGSDPLRRLTELLYRWHDQLAPYATESKRVSGTARNFILAIRQAGDPVGIFLEAFPQIFLGKKRPAFKMRRAELQGLVGDLGKVVSELSDFEEKQRNWMEEVLRERLFDARPDENFSQAMKRWRKGVEKVARFSDGFSQGTSPLSGLLATLDRKGVEVDSTSVPLTNKAMRHWGDADATRYEHQVIRCRAFLEGLKGLVGGKQKGNPVFGRETLLGAFLSGPAAPSRECGDGESLQNVRTELLEVLTRHRLPADMSEDLLLSLLFEVRLKGRSS